MFASPGGVASASSPAPRASRRPWHVAPEIRWCVILTVVTLLLYVRTVTFQFVNFDDDVHVYENPYVRAGLSWSGLVWAFQIHGPSQWHPLAWMSHQLDWQLFGNNPAGHHGTNLAWHLAGTLLLYVAIQELFGRPGAAAFVAAMFAVHPLNIESVAWVSERRNVLCGVFWMLAVISYSRYARKGGWNRYLCVTCWLLLALMSKPLAVTLPFVFALLDVWPLRRCPFPASWQPVAGSWPHDSCVRRSWSELALEKVPWLMASAGAGWLSYLCQERAQVVSSFAALPMQIRLENACASYGLYLRRMVWPTDLAVFYPHPAWHHPHPEQALLIGAFWGATVLLSVTTWVLWRIRGRPGLALGWFWFVGTLVPMIGLVQVGQQQLADRYAYIPMIGLGIMTVNLPSPRWLKRIIPQMALFLVVAWFGVSVWQLGFWQNSKTLFARTAAITTDNNWARLNLGLALLSEGKYGSSD
jgi:hypothetical protein